MNRYAILVITFVAQMCLGCSYAWSVFVGALKDKYSVTTAQAVLFFGIMIATFSFITPFSGKLQDRFGPRKVSLIGALFFAAGFILAGKWANNFWELALTLGVMSGLGLGSVYPCILATCVKWFPTRKGLISGMAVAGYAFGAVVISWLAEQMLFKGTPQFLQNVLGPFGAKFVDLTIAGKSCHNVVPVDQLLTWLGVVMGVIVLLGAVSLSVPQAAQKKAGSGTPLAAGVPWGDIRLWGMYGAFFAGTFAGLMAISQMKQIGASRGVAIAYAAFGVMLFNIANAVGRVTWGGLTDKIGGRASMIAGLILQGIAMATITLVPAVVGGSNWPFYLLAICFGFLYANNFVLYPAECARLWGAQRLGAVYGFVFSAFGFAGLLGPYTGGKFYDLTVDPATKQGSYTYALWIAAVVCWIGAAVIAATVKSKPEDAAQPVAVAAGARK